MHSLVKHCFVVTVGLCATVAIAAAQGTKASKAEETFIKDAMQGDLAEVNMGHSLRERLERELSQEEIVIRAQEIVQL